jgi:oligoendopeptidase F
MLDRFKTDYVRFNAASMREHYLYLSGQKTALEISPIYEEFGDLFTLDSVAGIKSELQSVPEHFRAERKALSHLLIFASEGFQENAVRTLSEEISRCEAQTTIEWQGRNITFQDAAVAIRNEPNRAARQALYRRRCEVIEATNEIRSERLGRLHESARALGAKHYLALHADLRRLDYWRLADAASALVEDTDAAYLGRLDQALKRDLGISAREADRADALFFFHLADYDSHFPEQQLMRVYDRLLEDLGIDDDFPRRILIDRDARPRKSVRAVCIPVSVPDEVRLVLRPIGGQTDYQALLHEAGHAHHYAGTAPELRPEFKYTGDYALTETYAFLFNHLITEPGWLSGLLGFEAGEEFIRSTMLSRLVTIRRYVAKLRFECELHENSSLTEPAARYSELLTRATGFATNGVEYLSDLDDALYAANYLRAWALEAILREHLKTRYGSDWWNSRRAGRFLRELWETGEFYSADEMAMQIGIGPISFDPLIAEFNRGLR